MYLFRYWARKHVVAVLVMLIRLVDPRKLRLHGFWGQTHSALDGIWHKAKAAPFLQQQQWQRNPLRLH